MADIKCCALDDGIRYYPENDSISALAEAHQIGFPEMYCLVQEYAHKTLSTYPPDRIQRSRFLRNTHTRR